MKMDNSRIVDTVKDLIHGQLRTGTLPTLTEDLRRDLGADSLDMVEIMMFTEDAFGIEIITEEEWAEVKTGNDIVKLVEKYTS